MRIQIIHGTQKYDLDIPEPSTTNSGDQQQLQRQTEANKSDEDTDVGQTLSHGNGEKAQQPPSNNWTIKKLKEEIETLIGVPVGGQRLIRKGSTLFGDDTPLSSLDFKPEEKIMVLGQKPPPPESVGESLTMKSLNTIENTVLKGIENKINDVDDQLRGIEQGFVAKDLLSPAINKLDKQLKVLNEDCMKTLEVMDAMQLSNEVNDKSRAKRKLLVLRVQDILRWHDKLQDRLEIVSSELNHKQTNALLRD